MTTINDIRQAGTPFEPFLYARVGEDRNGNTVTVLSALARLGFEPWGEAADLSDLTRDDARTRLDALLTRFGDVPALGRDHRAISGRLIDLLPTTSGQRPGLAARVAIPASATGLVPAMAVLGIILFLIQTFFMGSTGGGN